MQKHKLEELEKDFDLLKGSLDHTYNDSTDIEVITKRTIVPALALDIKKGTDMWRYMLRRYQRKVRYIDYHNLIDGVIEETDTGILEKVFEENDDIVRYVFNKDPYDNHYDACDFMEALLLKRNYDLADKILGYLLGNTYGDNKPQKNLSDLLYYVCSSSDFRWNIDDPQLIAFLNKWCEKLTDRMKYIKVKAVIDELDEIINEGASKGPMSFGMFVDKMQEGTAITELTQERLKREEKERVEESVDIGPERKTDEILDELNQLIGLDAVKADVSNLINLVRVNQIRAERGMKIPEMSLHLVFTGNPGTGKTTVARMIGQLYRSLGILSKGHLIEVDRSGLVAGYVGQTALKTQEVIDRAKGGILFIDEAYALANDSENDFGREAIDTILKAMEDYRDDFIVIVAGYSSLMGRFIDSNPGLKSRFNKYIDFADYTGAELVRIFDLFADKNEYTISPDAGSLLEELLFRLYEERDNNFGNARDVRNYFEKCISCQANRLIGIQNPTNEDIRTIEAVDIRNAFGI